MTSRDQVRYLRLYTAEALMVVDGFRLVLMVFDHLKEAGPGCESDT